MANGNKAHVFHEDPVITLVPVTEVPLKTNERAHRRVDKWFWDSVIARFKLLDGNTAMKIEFSAPVSNRANSGCYLAAERSGIKVSVTRDGKFAYVYPRKYSRKTS